MSTTRDEEVRLPQPLVVDVDVVRVARPVRRVVRALPPIVGRLPWCHRRGTPAPGGARIRRPLPPAGAPDRPHASQGAEQRGDRAKGGPGKPLGDRRGRGRARRAAPRAREPCGLRRDDRSGRERRSRDRARFRDPVLPGSPLARRPPRVVRAAPRRHAQVRGEPAEALPGHLQRQLGHTRPRGALGRVARDRPRLVSARHPLLPRRQPPHQADPVLGVADRRGPAGAPGRRLPRRGVHAPCAHDDARKGRLQPVVHVLHVEEHEGRDRRIRRAGPLVVGVLPAEHVAQHARHPPRVPPERRPCGVRGAARARRDAVPELRHLLGLRGLRERPRSAGEARSTSAPRSTRSRSGRSPALSCRCSGGSTGSGVPTRPCSALPTWRGSRRRTTSSSHTRSARATMW